MRIGDTATVEMFLKYGPLGMQLKRHNRDGYLCYSAGAAWSRFETNEYAISKLPTKLLKRTVL